RTHPRSAVRGSPPPARQASQARRGAPTLARFSRCEITSHMVGPKSTRADLRDRLGSGGRGVGTIGKLTSDEVGDVLEGVGFDFVMVDLEHSQLAEGDALRLIRHAFALGLPAVARIAEVDRRLVNRLLEAGAQGIQLSTVVRADQVRDLVAFTRYAPA